MENATPIRYARMEPEALDRIGELDRSEHVTVAYEIEDGKLNPVEVDWDVPDWFVERDGDHSLSEQLAFCRAHLDRGGVMLGAFKADTLAGVAIVRPIYREELAQLAFLHVSRDFRRQGVAKRLMGMAGEIARKAGALQMYVSSIPSSSAVGFYLSQGCSPAEDPDPALYALEPDDIHLILEL